MLNRKEISLAIKKLLNNEIIILPTNTIYGMSGTWSKGNQSKINQYKQSEEDKPLIVLISSVKNFNKQAQKILKSKQPTTLIISEDNQKIAYRLIKRRDIKKIIEVTGPIFSTSVNIHNNRPLNEKEELINFNQDIIVFFDQKIKQNKPSKIFDFETKKWIR